MTCSHFLLTTDEFEKIYKKEMDVELLQTTQCFQPMRSEFFGLVCDVKLFKGNKDNGGMDISFVLVEEKRKPKTPSFPDIFADDRDADKKTTYHRYKYTEPRVSGVPVQLDYHYTTEATAFSFKIIICN
jgi:hypothetical protein